MKNRKFFLFCLAVFFLLIPVFSQKKTAPVKSTTTTKTPEAKKTVDSLKKNPNQKKEEPVVVYNEDFVKGEELFQLNRPEKAIPYLEKSLEAENTDPKAYVYLGICYYQIENYDKSLAICVQGMAKEGTDKKILAYNAGNSCYAMGNYMRADASYAIALKEDETYSPAVLNRANAQLKLDQLGDARQNYRKYLDLEPETPQREKIEEILRLLDEEIERRTKEKPELINPDLFIENEKMEVGETPEKVELDFPVQNQNSFSPKELVRDDARAPQIAQNAENAENAEKIEGTKISAEEKTAPMLSDGLQSQEKSEKISTELASVQKNEKKIPPEQVDSEDSVAPFIPPEQLYLGELADAGKHALNKNGGSQVSGERVRIDEEMRRFEEERRQFEEERRRLEEEKRAAQAEKLRLEEENKRKALEEELRLSEEKRRKSEEEARLAEENRRKAQEEQDRIAAEKRALEEERRNFEKAKLEAELEAQKKALEEEKRKIEEQRLAMEAEQKRIAAENEKKALEEEIRKIEAAKAEEEKQKRIAEEAQRKLLEEELKRIEEAKLEEERQKIAAQKQKMEEDAKAQAQEEEKRRIQEEVAARVRAEEAEKARIAEENRKQEEAKKAAEAEEQRKREEETKQKIAEEKRKAEVASWPEAHAELAIKGGLNFTPDGDGHNDTISFAPSIDYVEEKLDGWELKVLDPQGNLFRTIKGTGDLPKKIEWDGKSDTGETVLSKNTYTAVLSVTPSAKDRARLGKSRIETSEKITTGLLLQVIVPGKEWKMVVNSINFVPNEALDAEKLTQEQIEWNSQTLDEIAQQIKEHPGASVVIVDGYANNISGTEKENREELIPLSQMRADAIVEELVKRGVSRSLLQATGMGGANPLAAQNDRANWYKNRRVEFRIKK